MDKQYDKTDIESIIEYASKAKNHAISDIISSSSKVSKKDKGGVGNLIQEDYFGIPRNSSSDVIRQIISSRFRQIVWA